MQANLLYGKGKEVDIAQIAQFTLDIQSFVAEFIKVHPTLPNAWKYVKGEGNTAAFVKAENTLIASAKGLIMAAFVGKNVFLKVIALNVLLTHSLTYFLTFS